MKKIIVSGNSNYGLAASIKARFPHANFFSRSENNYDLTSQQDVENFSQASLEYDVYISCSCLHHFHQITLLESVVKKWKSHAHTGHILVMGSTADSVVKGTDWIYPIEKKALKSYCRNLSFAALGGHGHKPAGYKMTYISVGYLNTPSAEAKHPGIKKITTDYVAEVIDWALHQPVGYNLNELSIDPIQEI